MGAVAEDVQTEPKVPAKPGVAAGPRGSPLVPVRSSWDHRGVPVRSPWGLMLP